MRTPTPPPPSDSGQVVLWTFLGVLYYIFLAGTCVAVGMLLSRANEVFAMLGMAGYFLGPILGFTIANSQMEPEKRDERKGLGIALALFFGLSCLLPVVICGGMILFHK